MYNLINSNFNRTYNPIGNRNALSDIKRLLTSRDTVGQTKACGYVVEVIKRYHVNSEERVRMIEYLLENDIVVFLCEATSNLSFPLIRLVLECIRLLWNNRRFFSEEHAANAMAAVLRSLSHYSATNTAVAVDSCLHFLCDLLNGVSSFESTSVLSHQSPYSIEQLLACFHDLGSRVCGNPKTILSGALVLDALISYQPKDLDLQALESNKLFEVVSNWFDLLLGTMKHQLLLEDNEEFGMFLVVTSQIGIDILRLMKVLDTDRPPANFVQTIVADGHGILALQQALVNTRTSLLRNISEIAVLVKDNQEKIQNEEYSVFLKLLLTFLTESSNSETLLELCDVLLTNGYLAILPQYQMIRNDNLVRNVSTLILGEVLKFLTQKYLISPSGTESYARDIQMGLVELQCGIERPDSIGVQLQKSQPYSLLIYMYFYCQSTEKPEDFTGPLLPHLVEHVLSFPKSLKPPSYIVKALWLVFAMSTVSNGSTESLDERISLEKATDRLVVMLRPDPACLYTHHPAVLLWAFTSLRIPYTLRLNVLSQWLATENSLPEDLSKESMVWELLLNVLIRDKNETTVSNCMDALNSCLEDDDIRQEFGSLAWSMIPSVLSRTLIDSEVINPNICYLLEVATSQPPAALEQADGLKLAALITTLFSKNNTGPVEIASSHRYECASLKFCWILLQMSQEQNDNKILLTFVNRVGFLPGVLKATESANDDVACSALQLLSHIVMYFAKNKYQAKATLQIQTDNIIKSLGRDSANHRGDTLLHLIYTVLSSAHTPLVLSHHIRGQPSGDQQYTALRALLFRVQMMLCCENMENQSPMGWKALKSIFKHAIVYQNDPKLVATLSTQPWTFLLIRFQLTQNSTKEFLTFTHNWLTLLRITISKSPVNFSKYSLLRQTLVMIKRNLNKSEDSEMVVQITNEILNDCNGEE